MSPRSLLICLPLALALACGGTKTIETPAPEPAPAPEPVASTDPLVVGPSVYSLAFENEAVRVLNVQFDPGEEIGMHSHPDHVAYVKSPGKLQITGDDGKPSEVDLVAGQAVYLPAQSHSAKNIGETPIDLVVVEIKVLQGTPAPAGADPLTVGPTIYKQIFDNERVRVLEATFAPHAEIAMHSHPDHAVYVLEGGHLLVTGADGTETDHELKAGEGVFLPAAAHSAKNPGDAEIKVVVFEIKGPAPAVATP